VHLLVSITKFQYSLMHGCGTYEAKYYVKFLCYFVFTTTLMTFIDRHILMLTIATYIQLWEGGWLQERHKQESYDHWTTPSTTDTHQNGPYTSRSVGKKKFSLPVYAIGRIITFH